MQFAEDSKGINVWFRYDASRECPQNSTAKSPWFPSLPVPQTTTIGIPLLKPRLNVYPFEIERPILSCDLIGQYLLGVAWALMQRFTLSQVTEDINQASVFLLRSSEMSSHLSTNWKIYQAALSLRHVHLSLNEEALGHVPAMWHSVSPLLSRENYDLTGLNEALDFVWLNGRSKVNERTVLLVPVEFQIQIDVVEPAASLLTAVALKKTLKRNSWGATLAEHAINLHYRRFVFRFWFSHLKSHFFSEGRILSDSFSFEDVPLCWLKRKPTIEDLKTLGQQVQYLATAEHLPVEERLSYARDWCDIVRILRLPDGCAAYSVLLEIISRLITFKMSIKAQHQRLMKGFRDNIVHLVNNAISMAVGIEDFELAIAWMESSRSLVCRQLLQLRTPLGHLQERHPDLADRFRALSSRLQSTQVIDNIAHPLHDQRRDLAEAWECLIMEIRALPSFGRFLKPPSWQDIESGIAGLNLEGIIVYLNMDEYSCDALALKLTRGEIIRTVHVPLSDFSVETFIRLYSQLKTLIHRRQSPIRTESTRLGRLVKDTNARESNPLAEILSELWILVVKPIVIALGLVPRTSGPCPRIWWCPCGLSTFLPIHAAGVYAEQEELGSNIFDYAVSSYIPTSSMLFRAARPQEVSSKVFHLLAVAQAEAQGWANLPGTKLELELVKKHASSYQITELIRGEATAEATKREMGAATWVHFACHGVQDATEPANSALILANGSRLTYLDLIRMDLPHAQFAFLSACQTAMGTSYLSHEFAHLATGMLMAGYRGVIGTMWAIRDDDAPFVANLVYEKLFRDGTPDHTQAAAALSDAVCALRKERGAPFESWVPFIHMGI